MSRPTIIVAAHKPYWMPADSLYLPVQVGAAGKESVPHFQRDDEGDNISTENNHYCELTGLYWAWKNLDAPAIGLAHYRRHFAGSGEKGVLTSSEAQDLLTKAPVVLPKKRKYYIETLESHYANTLDGAHIDYVRDALSDIAPDYLTSFNHHMKQTGGHMFNMMLMRKDLLDEYCSWLFPVLKTAEKHLDYSQLSSFEARIPGRMSEYLLDTWLEKNGIPFVEAPLKNIEPVNWVKKGGSFLAAKFGGKKYEKSF